MPSILSTANSLLKWVGRFGQSSVSAGSDCYKNFIKIIEIHFSEKITNF